MNVCVGIIMSSRGKRMVELALAESKTDSPHDGETDSDDEIILSSNSEDSASFRLFPPSDSDDDPTYYPSDLSDSYNEVEKCCTSKETYSETSELDISNCDPYQKNGSNYYSSEIHNIEDDSQEDSVILESSFKNLNLVISESPVENSAVLESPSKNLLGIQGGVERNEPLMRTDHDDLVVEDTAVETNRKIPVPRKKSVEKQKYIRKPDFCYYCENEVQNFARHINRNHSQELEVQRIFSLETGSLERKKLLASLRKKGNFLKNTDTLFKPVHKSLLNNTENNYAACPFCLGMYSRKLLWRHRKRCPQNKNPGSRTSLSDSQNVVLPKTSLHSDLRMRVFPRMLADKVSFVAKKDPLICAFGSRYLNTHREQHQINVCSRKMRELAKVLMESQKLDATIKNLFDLIQPKHFDTVVHSVKVIAKYDPQEDRYSSPTFAMNISRSLKDCCDIATLHIVKQKYNYENICSAEAEANITMFRRLLETTWKYEISSQAGNDLNTKTWNKITIIPLAADLKLFRVYLINKANEAEKKLKENSNDFGSFKLLMETIFCRLLLLNRKRVGELQRMKLATYMISEENTSQNYEEFVEAITPTEKILLKNFKRVVIRGKRGRGVPVLFSRDIQDHTRIILNLRSKFVQKNNLFLFANPKSDQPIVGYKVLQKHANLCGAKNPNALTSTKLRKHLATLTQIFNMTNNDIEQLATFMGHTMNVHSRVYRLPDDVFQTAKIAKILMLMEKGEAAKFKGRTLEEIDVNMEEEIKEDDEQEENVSENQGIASDIGETIGNEDEANRSEYCKSEHKTKKKRQLVPWTADQKRVVLEFFKNHIESKKPPKKDECMILIERYSDLLKNKSWPKIKVFIQNYYTKHCESNE